MITNEAQAFFMSIKYNILKWLKCAQIYVPSYMGMD